MTNVNKQLPKHLDDAWDNLMEVFNPMSDEHKEELDVSIDNTHLTQLGVMVDLKNPKTGKSFTVIVTDDNDINKRRTRIVNMGNALQDNVMNTVGSA